MSLLCSPFPKSFHFHIHFLQNFIKNWPPECPDEPPCGSLGPAWHLVGGSFRLLGTTFGPFSSLWALSGCLLEPTCAPKDLQDRSQDNFWLENLKLVTQKSRYSQSISILPTLPILQPCNPWIIQVRGGGMRGAFESPQPSIETSL